MQIAWGKLRWEGASWTDRKHGNSLRKASLGGTGDSMLDGQENMEIAYGELRWEGARQHAGRRGKRTNSLRKASLGGSETACWTEGKPWK